MKIQRGEGILKIMIIVFPIIVLGNTLEYFFVNKDNLKHVRGKVSEILRKKYNCPGGLRPTGYYYKVTCEKTFVRLGNIDGSFHVADYAGRDAYITGIEKGDEVDIYVRKWYQFILTFGATKDIYFLEKDGEIYYNIGRWKASNMAFIIVFGALTIFFGALYILQRVTINELLKGRRI